MDQHRRNQMTRRPRRTPVSTPIYRGSSARKTRGCIASFGMFLFLAWIAVVAAIIFVIVHFAAKWW